MKAHFPKVGAFAILVCSVVFLTILLLNNTTQAHTGSSLITMTPTQMPTLTPKVNPTAFVTATPAVIYVSQSSAYSDPSVVIAIISIIISGLSLAFVVKYVIDTSAMAKATQDSAQATRKSAEAAEKTLLEMRNAREEENAPFVIVYTKFDHENMMLNVVVENIGKTVAKDIKLGFDPPLQIRIFRKDDLEDNILLTNGIHSLVPNNKILIPFAIAINYFNDNPPMVYAVKVGYSGNDTLPRQEIRYDLDLNHYRYQLEEREPVAKIAAAMESLSSNFFQYTEYFKGLLYDANDISNMLSRNLARTSYAIQRQGKVDVTVGLKDFVLTWTLGYGKDKKLLLKPFLFDLRSKCLLLSEETLRSTIENPDSSLNKAMQDIGVKLCKLGNMMLTRDGYVAAHSIQGSSIEEFNDLGDEIITDIRNLLQQIEKAEENLPSNDEESSAVAVQQSEISEKS
ncbi:hypothetical protein KSF_084050 [Reticulibacter mediterranei]|uniref:Uncharacterized protein n=1 Tax=Reticulibacter mediterranei TaxID=2778369 RepID=A0A8J3N8K8_9CHLR|nr:hypothetical protein [Reticulibacter mediterranei]GHO98357.1 hypothetical protein KSF_084050 [Reticulibacter mediterranei]